MKNIQVNTIDKVKAINSIIRPFKNCDLDEIYDIIEYHLVHTYSKVYSKEIIEFYKEYHSLNNILNDSKKGNALILSINNEIIGTGTILNNYINRIFIKSGYQNQGYGTAILSELEKLAVFKNKSIKLDVIPGSEGFYIKNGYVIISQAFDKIDTQYLEYFKMGKQL
ncbi:GNAT family N-acetyltransferase [Bacteroidota bacterium]